MQVLVVEDVSVIRMMIAYEVEDCGWTVAEAGSVEDALTCWQDRDIDAAVIDIDLPDGSGADLIQRLRADAPKLPIVVHTAFRESDPEVSRVPADVTIICKPARRTMIAEALRRVTDQRDASTGAMHHPFG